MWIQRPDGQLCNLDHYARIALRGRNLSMYEPGAPPSDAQRAIEVDCGSQDEAKRLHKQLSDFIKSNDKLCELRASADS